MAAFTSITTGTKYLSRDIVNEVVLAYSERRQCEGDSAVAGVPVGFNLQSLDFWRGMQDWVETNCVKWVDDSSFSTATEYDAPADIAYTLATFRTEAGFNTDGFRRATEWPGTFSYGKIQAGDIIGPWIVEDLQAALDAMRWTFGGNTSTSLPSSLITTTLDNDEVKSTIADGDDGTKLSAYNNASALWPASWSVGFSFDGYSSIVYFELRAGDIYRCTAVTEKADVIYGSIPAHIAHSANAYFHSSMDGFGAFVDVNGIGIQHKKFFSIQSFTSATTTTRTASALTGIDDMPSYNATEPTYGVASGSGGDIIILKWTFTNTL